MTDSSARRPMPWIDLLKGLALLWVFLNHLSEQILDYPLIANPNESWPPLQERVAQLAPLTGHGAWDVPLNIFRYVGWSGDQGVQLFLILSGFALTWGLMDRSGGAPFQVRDFYTRRLWRIYPLWWAAHLLFMIPWLFESGGLHPELKAILSMAGLRCTRGLLYYFSPSWWYIGVLIQLYFVYPFLWRLLQRRGPLSFLILACGVGFAARALGLIQLGGWTGAWQRGIFFPTRLPEFAFGISLAAWAHADPAGIDRRLRSPAALAAAVAVYLAGTGLSLTLLGMAVAPAMLGVAAFVLLYAACRGREYVPGWGSGWIHWIGRHSYSIFLVHHPIILAFIPWGGAPGGPGSTALRAVAAVVLSLLLALALERATEGVTKLFGAWIRKFGPGRGIAAIIAAGAAGYGLLIAAELVVRRLSPQEAHGWGERASLAPNDRFGWTLIPSQTTRLRWESYDYTVRANSLGFPGPEYPVEKKPGTLRILTTGDAFTSAEGVDTELSWPRLLETALRAKHPDLTVEVMNFAITGYGPNQYAAVIREFAPRYKPDLILSEFFINDFEDVQTTDDQFRAGIGFELRPQGDWRQIVKIPHLRKWLRSQIGAPLEVQLCGDPTVLKGYFYAYLPALEKNPSWFAEGRRRLGERLGEMKRDAESAGARLVVVMVPSSAQVCDPARLPYFPRGVDLQDSARFDLEQPQRAMRELTQSAGYYDLREALGSLQEKAWQPQNLHWLAPGHRAVSDYLADRLDRDGWLRKP